MRGTPPLVIALPLDWSGMSVNESDFKSLSPDKQALLRVLADQTGPMTRGEILKALPSALRPTPPTVTRWLGELKSEGWIRNGEKKSVRGNPEANTWALAVAPAAIPQETPKPGGLSWPWLSVTEAKEIAQRGKGGAEAGAASEEHEPMTCFVFWGASGSARSGSLALEFAEGMASSTEGRQVLLVDLDIACADATGALDQARGLVGLMGEASLHEGERLGERLGKALRVSGAQPSESPPGEAQQTQDPSVKLESWTPLTSSPRVPSTPERRLWVLPTGLYHDESAAFALHRWLEERALEQPRSTPGVPKEASVGLLQALRRPSRAFNVVVFHVGVGRGLPALLALLLADMLFLCGPPVGGAAEALLWNVLASRHRPPSVDEPGLRLVGDSEDWSGLARSLSNPPWAKPLADARALIELGERVGPGAYKVAYRLARDKTNTSLMRANFRGLGVDPESRQKLLRGWMEAANPSGARLADALFVAQCAAFGGSADEAMKERLLKLVSDVPAGTDKKAVECVVEELKSWLKGDGR